MQGLHLSWSPKKLFATTGQNLATYLARVFRLVNFSEFNCRILSQMFFYPGLFRIFFEESPYFGKDCKKIQVIQQDPPQNCYQLLSRYGPQHSFS